MECRACATPVDPEWGFCEACGATLEPETEPVTPGRKWAGRLLRFLGTMVIGAAVIVGWIAVDATSGRDRSAFVALAIAAMVAGGGINYAGRRVDPHAGKVTVSGVLGGLLGGAAAFMVVVVIAGMMLMAAIAAVLAALFGGG